MYAYMLLNMENVNISFLGNQVLYDINMQMSRGEIKGLIGPNGSGKSTIVHILSGVYPPDIGDIYIDGDILCGYSPEDTLEKGVFTLYQEPNLIPEMSITDNLFAGNYEKSFGFFCNDKKMRRRAVEVLGNFGLHLSPDEKVKNLSKCEKEIVAVAKAFLRRAKLYLMDEPTAGMSEREQQVVLQLVKELKKNGSSVIYVTHRLEEIREVCDSLCIMRDGRIILDESVSSVTDKCIDNLMEVTRIESNVYRRRDLSSKIVMEVSHLSKKGAYDDISLRLHEGEILGIAGSMGSGRTALLKTLFGAIQPDKGSIYMDQKKGSFMNVNHAIEYNIGYMPDDRLESGIIPDLSVLDNTVLAEINKKKTFLINRKKEVETFIKFVVHPGYYLPSPNQAIKYASGGNQQKTVFFRWMISESKILLLDEPTKGIDIASKNEMYQMIFDKAHDGVSFIISSSDYKELQRLCSRVLVLNHGVLEENKFSANGLLTMG